MPSVKGVGRGFGGGEGRGGTSDGYLEGDEKGGGGGPTTQSSSSSQSAVCHIMPVEQVEGM